MQHSHCLFGTPHLIHTNAFQRLRSQPYSQNSITYLVSTVSYSEFMVLMRSAICKSLLRMQWRKDRVEILNQYEKDMA